MLVLSVIVAFVHSKSTENTYVLFVFIVKLLGEGYTASSSVEELSFEQEKITDNIKRKIKGEFSLVIIRFFQDVGFGQFFLVDFPKSGIRLTNMHTNYCLKSRFIQFENLGLS